MKVLVLGADGRAHGFVWKLFQSPQNIELICAPGNGGTSQLVPRADLDPAEPSPLVLWAFQEQVDIVIPSGESALFAGLVDEALALQISVFGPPYTATRIGRSRCAAMEFLLRHNIPSSQGRAFADRVTAEKYLAAQPLPVVLKADRHTVQPAVYTDRYAALSALHTLFEDSSEIDNGVVIEPLLDGITISCSALTDGQTALSLLPTRVFDAWHDHMPDQYAPGMVAYTTHSDYAHRMQAYLHSHILQPIIAGLHADGVPYWGFIGCECVITPQGPRVIALRCALHDLEAQVVLPRLEDDLLTPIHAALARRLDQVPPLRWRKHATVGVSLVAQGYPHHFPIGSPVEGLADIESGVLVFHNQTANPLAMEYDVAAHHGPGAFSRLIMGSPGLTGDAAIRTTGGHVLTLVAAGARVEEAHQQALRNAVRISFAGRAYRQDIGGKEFR